MITSDIQQTQLDVVATGIQVENCYKSEGKGQSETPPNPIPYAPISKEKKLNISTKTNQQSVLHEA